MWLPWHVAGTGSSDAGSPGSLWMGQVKHSWAPSQVPQRLLHRVGSHCLSHLIVLHRQRCLHCLVCSKLVTGARKGRSLGSDMPSIPWGRILCLSEAILERYFRCGFLMETMPRWWKPSQRCVTALGGPSTSPGTWSWHCSSSLPAYLLPCLPATCKTRKCWHD